MSDKLKFAMYWARQLRRLRHRRPRDPREDPRGRRAPTTSSSGRSPPTSSTRTSRATPTAPSTSASSTAPSATARTSTSPSCCARRARCWWPSAPAPTWAASPGSPTSPTPQEIKDLVYTRQPVDRQPRRRRTRRSTATVPEGELDLPHLYDTVKTLAQTVDVDYYMPGCPPEAHQISAVLDVVIAALKGEGEAAAQGRSARRPRPAATSARGARKRRRSAASSAWEFLPDPEKCLLEQGIICMGPATRAGCGARCTGVGMPCRGCYGAARGRRRPGRQDAQRAGVDRRRDDPEEIAEIAATVPDPLGTFYRFGLASRCSRRARGLDEKGKHRSHHPARGPRQDRDLPGRRRRGRQRLLPDPRAARLREVLRGPPGRGAGPHHAAHLRRVPGGPPHGRRQGGRRGLRRRVAPTGRKLRELLYNAFYVTDHTTHFYVLAGPDFVVGPSRDPAERNILGVIKKVGLETAATSSSCAPRPPSSSA